MKITDYISSLALAGLAIAFAALPWHFAVNIPNADDFDMLLAAVVEQGGWRTLLTAPAEHFIFFTRLCALFCVGIFGEIDFRLLILFGNISVFVVLWLLYAMSRTEKRIFIFLPAALILLQPSYVESSMWASGSLQHLWSWVFCLGGIFFLFRPGAGSIIAGVLFCLLAASSQANGILCLPLGGVVLLATGQYRRGAAAFGLGICVIGAYYAALGADVARGVPQYDPLALAQYILCFLGSAPGPREYWPALGTGAVLTAGVSALTLLGYGRKNPIIYTCLLLVLFTAVVNGLARSSLGVEFAYTQSRYTFSSALLIALCYLAVVEVISLPGKRTAMVFVSIAASALAWAYSYVANFDQFVLRNELLNESALRWSLARAGLQYPDSARAAMLLDRASAQGVFRMPLMDPAGLVVVPQPFSGVLKAGAITAALEHHLESERYVLLSGYALPRVRGALCARPQLVLASPQGSFRVLPFPRQRPDATQHHRRGRIANAGFLAVIDRRAIPPGEYRVGIMLEGRAAPHVVMWTKDVVQNHGQRILQ